MMQAPRWIATRRGALQRHFVHTLARIGLLWLAVGVALVACDPDRSETPSSGSASASGPFSFVDDRG